MFGIPSNHSIPSFSKNSGVNILPKDSIKNDDEKQNIPSFSSLQRKTSAVSLTLSPPPLSNDSSKHRRLSSYSGCVRNAPDSFSTNKPSFEIGLSSTYSSTNHLFAPSPSLTHRHSTGDLRSSNTDSEDDDSSDNSSHRPKRKYVPSFFAGSFWNIFPGHEPPTSLSKSQKKSESLVDVSKLSNERRLGSRRNSTLTLNTHPKRSRSSLPAEILPHPWGITMKHEDEDNGDNSHHTVIMLDRDSGIVVPKSQPLPSPRLATPRPIRMRSRSPRLGTIESVDCMEEERQLTLSARRNSSLSTVLEAPSPSVEDSLYQDKAKLPYSRRRMSAIVTSDIPSFKGDSTYICDDNEQSEDNNIHRRRSLKSITGSPISLASSDGWNPKMKIKYWKNRMSISGQQMFRSGGSNNEKRGSTLSLLPTINGCKRDNEGSGGSFRRRINSVTSLRNTSEKDHDDRSFPDGLCDAIRPSDGNPSETCSLQSRLSMTSSSLMEYPKPELVKPKWEDLELWEDEPTSWSEKYPSEQVTSSEKKRQNIIYELYMTEKNHCRVVILLQQVYQVGLRSLGLVSEKDLCTLIPDVLDNLLDFHLNLLRRLKERRVKSIIVQNVSDIVAEEFGNGQYTSYAINAYTRFCLAKEASSHAYHTLMERCSYVKKFFNYYESNPMYKQHNFKSCFLLVAQRITKYNLLLDQLLKYEPSANKPQTQLALESVRDLARHVDTELKRNEIQQKWEHLKSMLDKKSLGKVVKTEFTYNDLVQQRDVLAICKVYYLPSSASQTKGDKIELSMVLFDDILVLFCLKNNSLHFCNYNMMSSVIPLRSLIVREMERTNECILLCTDKEKPDMYRLQFPTKNDLMNWMGTIGAAKAQAPQNVRFAPGRKAEDTLKKEGEFNEDPHDKKVQDWQDELQAMFHERKPKEDLLRDYMCGRMRFFDAVRAHFKKFPIRHVNASSSSLPSAGAMLERRETKDLEKAKKFVQQIFHELRQHRRSGFDSLVEVAQKARDNDLESFFDDLNDLTIVTSSSSVASESERIPTSATSSEDEPVSSVSLASIKSKPRRVRTYHGTMDSSSAQPRDGSRRRHTTVPKTGKRDAGFVMPTDDEDEVQRQVNDDLQKLPFTMTICSRKAATTLILQNVNLRIDNNKLKSEIAMQALQIASLKSRKTAVIENAEKLESLRQKQEEIQTRERQLKQQYENFKDESRRKNDEFEVREDDLRRREAELCGRMSNDQPSSLQCDATLFKDSSNGQSELAPYVSSPSQTPQRLAVKSLPKRK